MARGWAPPRERVQRQRAAAVLDRRAIRNHLMASTVHIIGAGLAGLAAAVKLAPGGAKVVVHEATAYPGGRCRSYFDRSIGMTIDNGNHLVLSGNHAVPRLCRGDRQRRRPGRAGSADLTPSSISPPTSAGRCDINDGLPWWIFEQGPPRAGHDAFAIICGWRSCLFVRRDMPVASAIDCSGPLYERLVHPLLLAALNIEPREGSALLASAIVRETLARGGQACRPLIARAGLGPVFIEPAVKHLRDNGVELRLGHELRSIRFTESRIAELDFGHDIIRLAADDAVILAVPTHAAASLVQTLQVPQGYRAIANAHFRVAPPPGTPPMLGVINGTTEWIFAFDGRLSVTISAADRLMDVPREELAATIWREVAKAVGIAAALPPWQIVRERRATFAATPEENAKRPGTRTMWNNLFLAGDWTATGLPATLESAVRSGNRAAALAAARSRA